jgi:two-component system LytT family response regulator
MLNAISVHRFHVEPTDLLPPVTVKLPAAVDRSVKKAGKIVLPTMEGLCFEKIKHITYLEASGNYTVLHFADARQVLVCKTLREVELLLPAPAFVRIHRSHTVQLRHIKKYIRGKGGQVVLQNGVVLVVSAGQKEYFLDALKNYFG